MDLLELARRGDTSAFEHLIRPHLASIRRFAFAFTRHWDDADDLAQEALIKAFRSIPAFEGRSSLSTWLYSVTRSVCHDFYRSRLAKTRDLEEPLGDNQVDDGDDQESLLSRKGEGEQLWESIRRLGPEFRVAIMLCDVEGLSYAEVAQIEGVPVGTIRSRLSRARFRLRQMLARSGYAPAVSSTTTCKIHVLPTARRSLR